MQIFFPQYAMKVIDLSKSPPEERDAAVREAKLLQQLKHEHIVAYVSSFKDRASLCIVTEYCDSGDLSDVLEKQRGRALPEDQIVNWFGQICRALKVQLSHYINPIRNHHILCLIHLVFF